MDMICAYSFVCTLYMMCVSACVCELWRVNVTTDSDVLTSIIINTKYANLCVFIACVCVCVCACIWHTSLHLCMCVYYLCMDLNWPEKSHHPLFPWAAPGCCFSVGVHTSVPALWCQNLTHAISGLLPLVSQSCLCCKAYTLGTLPPALNTSPGKTALASISERIKYKVTCMCSSAINGSGPAYLSELLNVYTLSRTLCSSSDTHMLKIQQYKGKTHGFCAFSCFGSHIWNSLPQDLRHCSTLSSFKAKLKTLLTVFPHQLISIASFCYSHCVYVCVFPYM